MSYNNYLYLEMNPIKLDKYEINFLTEPFPLHLEDAKTLFVLDFGFSSDEAQERTIDLLKRMVELNFIQFEILLYYKSDDDTIKIVLDEPDKGFELKVDDDFWDKLRNEQEVWKRPTSIKLWSFGIDFTDEFYQRYFEPDDTEFYKLINQE